MTTLRKLVSRLFFRGNDAADAEREIALAVAARDEALRRAALVDQQAAITSGLLAHLRQRVANLRAEREDLRACLSEAKAALAAAMDATDKANAEAARLAKLLKEAKIELLRRPARDAQPPRRISAGTVEASAAGPI